MSPQRPPDGATGEQLVVQALLRGGLAVSSLLFVAGLVSLFARRQSGTPAVPLFQIFAAQRAPETACALAVLVLGATPLLRVLALVVVWTRERDLRFASVALAVACLLVIAILSGHG